jgi:spore germination cell wall hydrolase CwlJ-like protein
MVSTGVSAQTVYTSYTVKNGDTCYKIAKSYGVELSAIVNANGLIQNGALIYPGKKLIIDSNAKSTVGGNYTVKSGDSFYKIATSYNTTVSALKEMNGLSADRIYVGQVLRTTTNPGVTSSLSEKEIYLMAKMIYAEARGESYTGQVAVGAVIMNRIKSDLFPNTLTEILYQKSQFTAITDGQFDALSPDSTAIAAAYDAANGTDPTYGSLFYWNPQKANNAFLNAKTILVTIGNHVFAK